MVSDNRIREIIVEKKAQFDKAKYSVEVTILNAQIRMCEDLLKEVA